MSDLELTPEQWRMARQAGAALAPDSEEQHLAEGGRQLSFDGLGPGVGELYKNVHTGEMACVVSTATRRKSWVSLRHGGRVTEVPLSWLGEHWLACRPDGRLK